MMAGEAGDAAPGAAVLGADAFGLPKSGNSPRPGDLVIVAGTTTMNGCQALHGRVAAGSNKRARIRHDCHSPLFPEPCAANVACGALTGVVESTDVPIKIVGAMRVHTEPSVVGAPLPGTKDDSLFTSN